MENQAHFYPIFPFLKRTMNGYCRRDFKKAKIQIQKPILNHLPKRERFIFIRVNLGEEDEQELRFYPWAGEDGIIQVPVEFLGNGLPELKKSIEDYIKQYPKAAKRNSYRE